MSKTIDVVSKRAPSASEWVWNTPTHSEHTLTLRACTWILKVRPAFQRTLPFGLAFKIPLTLLFGMIAFEIPYLLPIGTPSSISAQQIPKSVIVLRDLSIVSNRQVVTYDLDGIQLDDGAQLNWSEVYSIETDDKKLTAMQAELSLSLFRLEKRMSLGNYSAAKEIAEKLSPLFLANNGRNAHLIATARLLGCLESSNYELAVVHLFELLRIHKSNRQLDTKVLKDHQLDIDFETGHLPKLVPVFFDSGRSREVAKILQARFPTDKNDLQFEHLYRAAIGTAANDESFVSKHIEMAQKFAFQNPWTMIVFAQKSNADLADSQFDVLRKTRFSNDPILWNAANFLFARQALASVEPSKRDSLESDQALNQLLAIAAQNDPKSFELAAASLFVASEFLRTNDRVKEANTIRNELLTRFEGSWHSKIVQNENKRK